MEQNIKLVAIDLDDTLLRDDGSISEFTLDTINAVRKKGVDIIIATGRMYSTAKPIGETIGLSDIPMIIYSGAMVQNCGTGEILYEKLIPGEIVNKIIDISLKNNWYIQVYVDDLMHLEQVTEFTNIYMRDTNLPYKVCGYDFKSIDAPAAKILAIDTLENLNKMVEVLQAELGDYVDAVRSKPNFLEIIAKGSSKGNALTSMAKQKGLDISQTMAIGNSQNDISMLEVAGVSVAVANAEENVKETAKVITASNNEDGVAKVLQKYFL